jgi:hypothetical protein
MNLVLERRQAFLPLVVGPRHILETLHAVVASRRPEQQPCRVMRDHGAGDARERVFANVKRAPSPVVVRRTSVSLCRHHHHTKRRGAQDFCWSVSPPPHPAAWRALRSSSPSSERRQITTRRHESRFGSWLYRNTPSGNPQINHAASNPPPRSLLEGCHRRRQIVLKSSGQLCGSLPIRFDRGEVR